MRRYGWLIAVVALIALWAWSQRAPLPAQAPAASHDAGEEAPASARLPPAVETSRAPSSPDATPPSWLPAQAITTLRLIRDGGPFPHRQDGSTFQNREGRLPRQPRGYYREYTVDTPGSDDRGARRIIAGDDPPQEFFYTDDHYRSFRRFTLDGAPSQDTRR